MKTCDICKRERTTEGRDAVDYDPLQVVLNNPLGWYSSGDGEICPEDMDKAMGRP